MNIIGINLSGLLNLITFKKVQLIDKNHSTIHLSAVKYGGGGLIFDLKAIIIT